MNHEPVNLADVPLEDRDRVWKIMTAIWPDYDEYATKTSRKIPLVAISVR